MDTIENRLNAVRQYMAEHQLDAFLIPRADEYLGEYVPAHNERLRWISGFTGSAGLVIVLAESAGLEKPAAIFVDGRYTIQVRQQTDEALFDYHHLVEVPHLDWLIENLPSGGKVGFDARLHTYTWQQNASKKLAGEGLSLEAVSDNPVDLSWKDRPKPPKHPVLLLGESFTGASSAEKRQRVAAELLKNKADAMVISQLDTIAWLLNIRGKDISCLPVVLANALLHSDGSMELFIDTDKIPAGFDEHVGAGVSVQPQSAYADALKKLGSQKSVLQLDPATTHAWSPLLASEAGASLTQQTDPSDLLKACKNATELAGMQRAHLKDALAMVGFLSWFDSEVAAGNLHDEGALSDKLLTFRQAQPDFQETSFDTISAAGPNAAMCHYNHLNGTPAQLTMNSVYLLDSGGQYLDGTTDITRTLAVGEAPEETRRYFTLVLKGHIALDQIRFPKGTTGQQLDVLARQFLWQAGVDYDHGTGHGVGHFLSVHEGPQRIGKNSNGVALAPGMVLSNEPGYYQTDGFGIRSENLIYVTPCEELAGAEREMYQFKSLTLVPFDRRLLVPELFTEAERRWLNDYHAKVWLNLSEHITEEAQRHWLEQACMPI